MFSRKVDILCLQETKLAEEKFDLIQKWWEGPQFWSPAQGTRGGVAILLHRNLQGSVLDAETDLWGKWAWVRLQVGKKEWVLATVYSPTDVAARVEFFTNLQRIVPQSENVVILGDWNLSLDEALRKGSRSAGRKDTAALLDLIQERDLSDPFRWLNPEDPGFTWFSSARREGDGREVVRRRLDYCLVGKGLAQSVTYVQQISHPLSDHKPVAVDIVMTGEVERGESYFKLNSQNLEDSGLRSWVSTHMENWQATRLSFPSTTKWLDGGLAVISGVLNVSSRILARERNKEEDLCRRRVEEAERRMESHPISELVWAKERERRLAEWDKLQVEKQQRWEETLRIKDIQTYDMMSNETFRRLLPSISFQQVVQLQHPFDRTAQHATSNEGMLEYVRMYYSDILTARRTQDTVDTDLTQELNMWEDTAVQLEVSDRLLLDRPITEEELKQTLRVMTAGKCPGRDGLTVEFHGACWDALGPPLVEVVNEVLLDGKLGGAMTHRVILVMFKKGDKANIKILAKALTLRLGKVLPKLVEKDQGAFVQGRSIFINILTGIESIEAIQAEEMNLVVLLLDIEKTYDRVGWSFVLTTMRKMGFSPGFCKWVIAMYMYATSAVQVNGHLSDKFQLTRSLRQGCPLAPLLFVLELEVPLNRIRNHPRIQGLPLSSDKECRTKALADDLFLISANTVESLEAVKDVLLEYSGLYEASVNWNKSTYLLPEDSALRVEWGMQRVNAETCERFLGVLSCFRCLSMPMTTKQKRASLGKVRGIYSDPYASVDLRNGPLGARMAQTRVIRNTPRPIWNERFRIITAHMVTHVVITLKDADLVDANLIGRSYIPFETVGTGERIEQWFDVVGSDKKTPIGPDCKVRVAMQFFPVLERANQGVMWEDKGKASPLSSQLPGVPNTYFPLRVGGEVKLYQDAHVREGTLPRITLKDGRVYAHGMCWWDIANSIANAQKLVYIVGWSVYYKTPLVRDKDMVLKGTALERYVEDVGGIEHLTLGALLKMKADEGVKVLLLVWDDKTSHNFVFFKTAGVMGTHDEETKSFFRHSRVKCVLATRNADSKLSYFRQGVVSTFYTHHQKTVVVDAPVKHDSVGFKAMNGERTLIAYLGGIDLCDGRYDYCEHPLFRTGYGDGPHVNDLHQPNFPGIIDWSKGGPRQPWHDIHCRIEGPAAFDVLKNFEQRWLKSARIPTSWWKLGFQEIRNFVKFELTHTCALALGVLRQREVGIPVRKNTSPPLACIMCARSDFVFVSSLGIRRTNVFGVGIVGLIDNVSTSVTAGNLTSEEEDCTFLEFENCYPDNLTLKRTVTCPVGRCT
ncbi:hypothetical protein CBR_g48024 [Chara braunii]|uniref:phospholipase D n=1 Tax=Chara braunii TaxID=69332 RepID=A0A388M218_CHABU|nr:hypothetical protein CBR_g48024 [Chara braunii]|eukprot:GBG88555.1 hypothetical protein CBR_g48024 [Chara braunii]